MKLLYLAITIISIIGLISCSSYVPNAKDWYDKGVNYGKLGKYEDEIESYDKAIEIKPDYYYAWYNKGLALYDLKRHKEALVSFDKAIAIKPDDNHSWYNKGIVLSEIKRYKEAVECFDKVTKIIPDDAEAWYSLAAVNAVLNNKKDMLKYLRKGIELYNNNKGSARKDEAFKAYWNDPDFIELTK